MPMWDSFTHYFGKILVLFWFTGVGLMLITIPACMCKIFSALWEDENPNEEQAVPEQFTLPQYTTSDPMTEFYTAAEM